LVFTEVINSIDGLLFKVWEVLEKVPDLSCCQNLE
jgi:hypothetical protein